ncbi:MAG: C45 family autoproteolytic acyltransferase/hydrolase [Pirellula sp.]|jgi:dienelactone hydrolase
MWTGIQDRLRSSAMTMWSGLANVLVAFAACSCISIAHAQDGAGAVSERLGQQMSPWLKLFQLEKKQFTVSGKASLTIDGKPQDVSVQCSRHQDAAWDLSIEHPEYAVRIVRRARATVIALPKHKKLFWGEGDTDPKEHLDTQEILKRLVRPTTEVAAIVDVIRKLDASALSELLLSTRQLQAGATPSQWRIDEDTQVEFSGAQASATGKGWMAQLKWSDGAEEKYGLRQGESIEAWVRRHWADYEAEALPRDEIERTLVRGARRALEVVAPSARLRQPSERNRTVDHGELRWIEGHRVALLYGTPEQIGTAHGQLLKAEATRCVDSVLYGFGLAQTIANGRWFANDLEGAYARLRPHIPERHIEETRAIARAIEVDEHTLEILNVFPELFHCSGFAVFGSATEGGKLYHGRVLDYMTAIGLQDAATTFIVAPAGHIPFVNVGYAGFTGSVSGMNAEKISLGEMGGKGEGQWDGVPMATLMRRGLEECDSLDKVKELWRSNPRTCEYYYVFADGESKSAVGVAATPSSIEFVEPGAAHPLLGEGIRDAVVLSAGSRLEELRRRVVEKHGGIDAVQATELMCRPVAMSSNLHNVLFVPEDGELYVANASHSQPAAERPYVKLNFLKLLDELVTRAEIDRQASQKTGFSASDSLNLRLAEEASKDARDCLEGLLWQDETFTVELEKDEAGSRRHGHECLVRFPSPMPSGDPINDRVAMEWYRAERDGLLLSNAPAVVVVHESGRSMPVGRLIARGLSKQGVHALMLQLPTYGVRRNEATKKSEGQTLIDGLKQGIADARRAYDAVRVLPGVDPERVSLQGTSLGGFVVATATGLDHAYHRSFVLLAGGDLYSVLANGDRDAAKTRQELERSGISMEKAKAALNTIEPLRLAHRVAPERTWLFSGTHDTVVPPASSHAFATAARLPGDHHIELPADHYSGIVFLPGVIEQIAKVASEPAQRHSP